MIRGKVIKVLPPEGGVSKAGKPWKRQMFVIETDGQYPKTVAFSVMGEEKIAKAGLQIGHTIEIDVDAESREYNGKWYTSLNAWRIKNINAFTQSQNMYQQQAPQGYVANTQQMQQPMNNSNVNDDPLPF